MARLTNVIKAYAQAGAFSPRMNLARASVCACFCVHSHARVFAAQLLTGKRD